MIICFEKCCVRYLGVRKKIFIIKMKKLTTIFSNLYLLSNYQHKYPTIKKTSLSKKLILTINEKMVISSSKESLLWIHVTLLLWHLRRKSFSCSILLVLLNLVMKVDLNQDKEMMVSSCLRSKSTNGRLMTGRTVKVLLTRSKSTLKKEILESSLSIYSKKTSSTT